MFHLSRATKDEKATVEIVVSNRTVVKVVMLVVLSLLLLDALRLASHAILLIFTAFFLALALNAPVHRLANLLPGKRRGSRALATSLSFLIVVVVLGIFLWSIIPPLVKQSQSFIHAAPNLVHSLHSGNSGLGSLIHKYHLEGQVDKISKQLSIRLQNIGGSAVATTGHVLSSVFSMLAILALTFMMLIEGPRWLAFIKRLFPKHQQVEVERLTLDMYKVVKGYVNGQVTLAALAALLISPALFILHISYPVALIAVIFLCGLIPLVGHTIGAVIVTLVALAHSLPSALIILTYYILYQQVENYLIQPRIQANSTNMSPLLVFMAVIIGVSFSGLFGGLVAIPIAGCLRILVLDYLYDHKVLDSEKIQTTV
ncbi:MAG TPA: AI-2E family transporter [Candidatus Saccharimonadales bacterium]|nr:AI-2E family transporter [Candidatus Saccharimonadales bacterium]